MYWSEQSFTGLGPEDQCSSWGMGKQFDNTNWIYNVIYLNPFYSFLGTIDFNDFLTIMTQKMSEKDVKEEILKAFRLFDDDETGKISFRNLKRVAKELGENLTDEELQVLLEHC